MVLNGASARCLWQVTGSDKIRMQTLTIQQRKGKLYMKVYLNRNIQQVIFTPVYLVGKIDGEDEKREACKSFVTCSVQIRLDFVRFIDYSYKQKYK